MWYLVWILGTALGVLLSVLDTVRDRVAAPGPGPRGAAPHSLAA